MSSIQPILYRSNDHRMLRVNLVLGFDKPYDFATISFKCGNSKVEINTTSSGSIDQEGNVRITEKKCEMYLDYCENSDILECLVGYYIQNDLIYYETLTASFDNTKKIDRTHISIPTVGTTPGSYSDRLADFLALIDRRKSLWEIRISCPDDVFVEIVKKGTDPTMVSFGEVSKDLRISDYIFKIDATIQHINIPKDLVRQYYPSYAAGTNLGIFELVRPDFLGVPNVYYKVLISNTLSLSSFTK